QIITERCTPLVHPESRVQTHSLDYERVSFPPAHRVSVKSRVGIVGYFPAIRPNFSPDPIPFENLNDLVGQRNELKRPCVNQSSQQAGHIRVAKRIISCRRNNSSGPLAGPVCVELRHSGGGEGKRLFAPLRHGSAATLATALQPDSTKIVWVVRWTSALCECHGRQRHHG